MTWFDHGQVRGTLTPIKRAKFNLSSRYHIFYKKKLPDLVFLNLNTDFELYFRVVFRLDPRALVL